MPMWLVVVIADLCILAIVAGLVGVTALLGSGSSSPVSRP